MKKFITEFKEFVAQGNVMDMAIGVIIGAAFKAIIDSLVKDILNPLIALYRCLRRRRRHHGRRGREALVCARYAARRSHHRPDSLYHDQGCRQGQEYHSKIRRRGF